MNLNIFLYIYIIAGLTGLLTMLLISLIRNQTSCNRKLLSKIGGFVLCMICSGLTVSEISSELRIPQFTVRLIIAAICEKLDVATREELIYLVDKQ